MKKKSEELAGTDYEINEDGSITPKDSLSGWNTYPWTCCECHLVFSLADELKEHCSSVHNAVARYLCVDCPKVYSKYSTFLTHVKVHRTKLKFCCDVCYKWFPSVSVHDQHRVIHGEHICTTCGKRFRMQSALQVKNVRL